MTMGTILTGLSWGNRQVFLGLHNACSLAIHRDILLVVEKAIVVKAKYIAYHALIYIASELLPQALQRLAQCEDVLQSVSLSVRANNHTLEILIRCEVTFLER